MARAARFVNHALTSPERSTRCDNPILLRCSACETEANHCGPVGYGSDGLCPSARHGFESARATSLSLAAWGRRPCADKRAPSVWSARNPIDCSTGGSRSRLRRNFSAVRGLRLAGAGRVASEHEQRSRLCDLRSAEGRIWLQRHQGFTSGLGTRSARRVD